MGPTSTAVGTSTGAEFLAGSNVDSKARPLHPSRQFARGSERAWAPIEQLSFGSCGRVFQIYSFSSL